MQVYDIRFGRRYTKGQARALRDSWRMLKASADFIHQSVSQRLPEPQTDDDAVWDAWNQDFEAALANAGYGHACRMESHAARDFLIACWEYVTENDVYAKEITRTVIHLATSTGPDGRVSVRNKILRKFDNLDLSED